MEKSILLLTTLLLSGCAGMNGDFDCNKSTTDKCLTMEQAQSLAIQNKSVADLDAAGNVSIKKPVPDKPEHARLENKPPLIKPYVKPEVSSHFSGKPSISLQPQPTIMRQNTANESAGSVNSARLSDITQRIWLSQWVDKDDNFHQPSVVEFVIKKSQWKNDFDTINAGD